ncbi:MAG: 16S rRNA (cytosine1402-N4)-methyltransferase [Parcubacteria group bacterium Gr01-1014_17]|nr:MAG: 16S rRNA (cytosine1402-N4)-methyltransferase [Parcubacteria group bacterium Gr01-1014_17]
MHLPVLLQRVVEALRVKSGEIFLDCTVGSGGHIIAIAQAAGGSVIAIGLDEDEDALARTKGRLAEAGIVAMLRRENFRNLDKALQESRIASVDAILFDLGVSTDEFLESGRGFSFSKDEPLLMTFRKSHEDGGLTARQVVNEWGEENLATILLGFGGERYAKRIARAIVAARERAPIETSKALSDIVSSAVPRFGRTHPATKTFQAIRMAVNDELSALEEGLRKAPAMLKEGGRIAVISFHSGEDRIVKRFFKEAEKNGVGTTSKKPVVPSREEIQSNPRSRSAKLRVFIKR